MKFAKSSALYPNDGLTHKVLANTQSFFIILNKQIVWCTLQKVTDSLEIFKFYSTCFIFNYFLINVLKNSKLAIQAQN